MIPKGSEVFQQNFSFSLINYTEARSTELIWELPGQHLEQDGDMEQVKSRCVFLRSAYLSSKLRRNLNLFPASLMTRAA